MMKAAFLPSDTLHSGVGWLAGWVGKGQAQSKRPSSIKGLGCADA